MEHTFFLLTIIEKKKLKYLKKEYLAMQQPSIIKNSCELNNGNYNILFYKCNIVFYNIIWKIRIIYFFKQLN